ncbi:JAB domain-containing protein [Pedobacter nyackensis]|uniref:DNA repair protein radc n=1 Tax=Pedobacter nyackensis TaxID=475255 RepID=A0A1W2DAN4_9SPHI|nr:JAB domain-containing protein [Pedobacter nyackensis]SMC94433.1 DNA repair protein radc [Pedobacter nyackensis]
MVHNTLFKVAEIEISYKPNYKPLERPKITTSEEAYAILIANWSMDKIEFLEEFKIILLNRRNRVLGLVNISQGGVSGTLADPKVIFAVALKSAASGCILAHNHPSGELKPGSNDINLTRKLREGARLLDIEVMDHLIVSKDGFYSFADEGLL